jgi:hypothetical protein
VIYIDVYPLKNFPDGYLWYWDIENKEWRRISDRKVALKSLDNSSNNISTESLNEVNKIY